MNPIMMLVLAVCCSLIGIGGIAGGAVEVGIVSVVAAAIFGVLYFLRKGTYLKVSFPGESRELSVKMYDYKTVLEFNKKLQSVIKR